MVNPKTNHPKFRFAGVHLVRDPNGRFPPKIMTIREDDHSFNANIFTLNVSNVFQQISSKTVSFVDKKKSLVPETSALKLNKKILSTLFDSTSHMLYVDFSTSDTFEMEQFFVSGLHTDNFKLISLHRYYRSSPSSRFEWQEDQYAGKFYYKERIDDQIQLFEIPMNALVATASEGEAGVKVGKMNKDGVILGATGGAFFTSYRKREGNMTKLYTSLVPANLSAGFKCEKLIKPSSMPNFYELIIIKNNDYCMLRDGTNFDRKNCEMEQKAYLISKQVFEDEPTNVVMWLLVVCIIMFMIIMLLYVYIYWLRSTFVAIEERALPTEFETEASLFVAKQRSFQSAYYDPALLDVSVDKWN